MVVREGFIRAQRFPWKCYLHACDNHTRTQFHSIVHNYLSRCVRTPYASLSYPIHGAPSLVVNHSPSLVSLGGRLPMSLK
jgi:hypothetical protein